MFEKEAGLGGMISSIAGPDHHSESVEVGVTALPKQDALLSAIIDDVGLRQDIISSYLSEKSTINPGTADIRL